MEHMLLSRALWTSDSKCVPPHPGDAFASVHITHELPAGAAFGPCVLHNGFYDTIAFIALKARDNRNNCYAFRVDPESMRSSPLVLPWLRLVQAARNRAEQNTEAFLKAGQLFFRTLRHVQQGEELLVWYDEELTHLLGLSDIRVTPTPDGFCCLKCGQSFQHEHPYLAHCRFLCTHNKADWVSTEPQKYKQVSDWFSSEPQKYKQVSDWLSISPRDQRQPDVKRTHRYTQLTRTHTHTDFHNIARDLEKRRGGSPPAEPCPSPRKRRHDDVPSSHGRKSVLLEKPNPSNESNIAPLPQGGLGLDCVSRKTDGSKDSALTGRPTEDRNAENPQNAENPRKAEDPKGRTERCDQNYREPERVLQGSVSSAFSGILWNNEEQRSAFCRPNRRTTPETHTHSSTDTHSHTHSSTDTHSHTHSTTTLYSPPALSALHPKPALSYRNVLGSTLLYGDLASGQPGSSVLGGGLYPYTPDQWPRGGLGVPPAPPAPPATLALLPPTLSSMSMAGQNWCAKCNLSFRMTSDLVLHMRSHHKREPASTAHLRRRREERLSCPVCHEHFKERHHLSRHMTSHN
ncbi:PR domain zinc finger protein 8 [Clupea harengus]|uniref:PR domain zinc finger protein 8 n=1 Tax=Clupea harengus TaxID=7950 RepID=A0A6P8GJ35_CLUHA|nr:PR domain zinc finger protein 8 [Clupea harengus]